MALDGLGKNSLDYLPNCQSCEINSCDPGLPFLREIISHIGLAACLDGLDRLNL